MSLRRGKMVKYCSECGAELKVNANFCDNCSSQIKTGISNKKIAVIAIISIIIIAVLSILLVWYSGFFNNLDDLGYSNSEYGFGFNPPAGWTKDTSGTLGVIVIFYSPINDDFSENINVIRDVLPIGISLSSFVDIGVDQCYNLYTDFSLISSNPRTVNGMNAYEIVYTYNQGIYELLGKQVVVEKNSELILLTYTAEIEDYNVYFSEFEQSVNSLKIV